MENKNVSVISDQVNDTNSQLAGSTMTKAGRLAMELSHEKKRLKQELEELQTEYDEIKPTTPTGTTDWYVKWMSMLLAVVGIFLISASASASFSSLNSFPSKFFKVSLIDTSDIALNICNKLHASGL